MSNFNEDKLYELLDLVDDIVYDTVDLNGNNPVKLCSELYKFIDYVNNYDKEKRYKKDLKKIMI